MSSLFSSLASEPKTMKREPPTDMVILFKPVCFEIMTSFVVLDSLLTITACPCVFVSRVCACACMSAHMCPCVCVCECAVQHMCECLHSVLRTESERQRPLIFSPSESFSKELHGSWGTAMYLPRGRSGVWHFAAIVRRLLCATCGLFSLCLLRLRHRGSNLL